MIYCVDVFIQCLIKLLTTTFTLFNLFNANITSSPDKRFRLIALCFTDSKPTIQMEYNPFNKTTSKAFIGSVCTLSTVSPQKN